MRVLLLTNMYPHAADASYGTFVYEQARAIRAAGIELDTLFVNGRASRWNYLAGYPRFWLRLARGGYDLVHSHYVFSGLIARAQLGLPVVQSFHAPGLMPTYQGWLCRRLHPMVDAVIATTPAHAALLGCPRAHIIPCGVDLEVFRPMPKVEARVALGWPLDRRILAWVGDPRAEKRVDLVRKTHEILRQSDPKLELRLVSRAPHRHIPLAMNAADVFLFPSDHEGSPVVIKEAMACNLPIVATPVGDLPELFRGVRGCVLSSPHPEALAADARALLATGERSAGREAVRHLSTENEALRIIAVYEEVLERRAAVRRRGRRRPVPGLSAPE